MESKVNISLRFSMVFGNIFVFYKFQGQETVDAQTRMVVFIALTAVCVVGTVLMVGLKDNLRCT